MHQKRRVRRPLTPALPSTRDKVYLITDWSELRASRSYCDELDRTEAVRQMHRENRHQQEYCHRYAGKCHECTHEDRQPPKQFGQYADPCHEMRRRGSQRVQNCRERVRAAGQLGKTVLHESETDDQAERNWRPSGESRSPPRSSERHGGQSRSGSRKETVRNRRPPNGRGKESPVLAPAPADPCEQCSQGRITELRHRLRVGDRRAALQRRGVAQDVGFARQLGWRVHCGVLLPRLRCVRPPTKPFDGFPDRLRMRAVVGLELPGDRDDLVGEESASQCSIVSRDAEVLALQPLIENVHIMSFVHGRILSRTQCPRALGLTRRHASSYARRTALRRNTAVITINLNR